jgi:cation transport regulator ChaC
MVLGHIKGHVRRFWQGNTVHRGTVENVGRVATLISETNVSGIYIKVNVNEVRSGVKLFINEFFDCYL